MLEHPEITYCDRTGYPSWKQDLDGERKMKITGISHDAITFDNGKYITYDNPSFAAYNYADFEYLKDEPGIYEHVFDENLDFEPVYDQGFRFGNKDERMFFVPCYSEQNGWYATGLDLCYDGNVITVDCEIVF